MQRSVRIFFRPIMYKPYSNAMFIQHKLFINKKGNSRYLFFWLRVLVQYKIVSF
jgi:hypothetical protein